jgi:alanyl-tRNA synthetase
VSRVGDIGQFKIIEESSIASGIRRIVALAGEHAVRAIQQIDAQIRHLSHSLHVSSSDLGDRVSQLIERSRSLEKEVERLNAQLAASSSDELLDQAVEVGSARVLAARMDGIEAKSLRETVDHLKDKLGSSVVVIGSGDADKVRLAAGVSQDLTDRIKAGDLVNFVAEQVGGRGGGRPDFAQAGGSEPQNLAEALGSVESWVAEKL